MEERVGGNANEGRIARVFMQREEWYLTVDGVDIEEVFDGMIFGG